MILAYAIFVFDSWANGYKQLPGYFPDKTVCEYVVKKTGTSVGQKAECVQVVVPLVVKS